MNNQPPIINIFEKAVRKAGKKLLGTSIADSIEKKLLEDANLNKQDIKLIQMKISQRMSNI